MLNGCGSKVHLPVSSSSKLRNTLKSQPFLTMSSASMDPLSDEQTCHILPCNINYQGMGRSHLYFRPVESPSGCYNSSLRGRGLVALKDESNKKSNTVLLSCQNETLSVKASIDIILEWQHEHDPEAIQCDGSKARVSVAQEWLEVSHAVS